MLQIYLAVFGCLILDVFKNDGGSIIHVDVFKNGGWAIYRFMEQGCAIH